MFQMCLQETGKMQSQVGSYAFIALCRAQGFWPVGTQSLGKGCQYSLSSPYLPKEETSAAPSHVWHLELVLAWWVLSKACALTLRPISKGFAHFLSIEHLL